MAGIYLRHFDKDEILITRDQARRTLVFFFGSNVPPTEQLTDGDVAFAQALLLEAIDKSYAMAYVHALFDAFYGKVPTSPDWIKDAVEAFAKKAAKNWFVHATGKDLSNPKICISIRGQITSNFQSVWQIRMNGLDLTY